MSFSRAWCLALLLGAISCAGRCACDVPLAPTPPPKRVASSTVGSLRWAVSSGAEEPLQLVGPAGRLSIREGSGAVFWVARGVRGRWIHHLELALDVNRLAPGRSSLNLTTSRCRVRYLQDGRETEADYAVAEARVESLAFNGEQWTADVDLTCAKIVAHRSDGERYAAPLPEAIRAQATAWARASL